MRKTKIINGMVIKDGILNDGRDAKGDVIIPNGVKVINYHAFSYNDNITSITIPKSVKIINNCAFLDCCNLRKVIYKNYNKIKYISPDAFRLCSNLGIEESCPKKGSFIGFASFIGYAKYYGEDTKYIAMIGIPNNAIRKTIKTGVCKCNKAKILSISTVGIPLDNGQYTDFEQLASFTSYQNKNRYYNGDYITSKKGIYFTMTKKDAIIFNYDNDISLC